MKILTIALFLLAIFLGCFSQLIDVEALKSRWLSWRVVNAADFTILKAIAENFVRNQSADGSWNDIDYGDKNRSLWKSARHLERLSSLAKLACSLRSLGRPDSSIEYAGIRAISYWVVRDFKNPNWWWNDIGTPKSLGESALLLESVLTKELLAGVDKILHRASWKTWIGQNLVWGTSVEIVQGLLDNDTKALQESFHRLFQEVRVLPRHHNTTWEEGIQEDGSFHEHHSQLYSGGYGYSFANDVGGAILLAWNTPFHSSAAVEEYVRFLLDGQQWMMRGGVFDYLARGREITRESSIQKSLVPDFVKVVVFLSKLSDVPRRKELIHFASVLQQSKQSQLYQKQQQVTEVVGNKHYWNSDYMIHRRSGYSVSVRMFSSRLLNSEMINEEGLCSTHLADAASLLYRTGDEYFDVFPVWDWSMVPGTTALHWLSNKRVPITGERNAFDYGSNDFAGGVSDGEYGATGMDLHRGYLTAKKSFFFFDEMYLALGAGISVSGNQSSDHAVITTIEQSHKLGGVTQRSLSNGMTLVEHNITGYVIRTGTSGLNVVLKHGEASGRWSDIGSGRTDLLTMSVFLLALDYGITPSNSTYEYRVLPEGGMVAAEREAKSPSVKVLQNTPEVQAVERKEDGLVQAMFFSQQGTSVSTSRGVLRVSQPCAVMIRHKSAKTTEISVSSPQALKMTVHVWLGNRTVVVSLEGDMSSGRSVTTILP